MRRIIAIGINFITSWTWSIPFGFFAYFAYDPNANWPFIAWPILICLAIFLGWAINRKIAGSQRTSNKFGDQWGHM